MIIEATVSSKMKANTVNLSIFIFISNLYLCSPQKLTFGRDVTIEPIGKGLFLFNYAGVLDYYDKYNHKKSYIRSVLLHDSRNKTLGRALR